MYNKNIPHLFVLLLVTCGKDVRILDEGAPLDFPGLDMKIRFKVLS